MLCLRSLIVIQCIHRPHASSHHAHTSPHELAPHTPHHAHTQHKNTRQPQDGTRNSQNQRRKLDGGRIAANRSCESRLLSTVYDLCAAYTMAVQTVLERTKATFAPCGAHTPVNSSGRVRTATAPSTYRQATAPSTYRHATVTTPQLRQAKAVPHLMPSTMIPPRTIVIKQGLSQTSHTVRIACERARGHCHPISRQDKCRSASRG